VHIHAVVTHPTNYTGVTHLYSYPHVSLFFVTERSLAENDLRQARILWVYHKNPRDLRAERLYHQMQRKYLQVDAISISELRNHQLADVDLVLLEAFEQIEELAHTAVISIRFKSRVPLVVLTNNFSSSELVSTLLAGVDAIWFAQYSVPVLLARCNAMLRRWRWNLTDAQTNMATVMSVQTIDEDPQSLQT
jgi:DNA-binding response OmpR family regulator